ncbi:MAG: alcohol dehydrogenase, propanol-preferring [Mycobacterium sp.]|nr:alcohol dehydrogenase, propanol-preferring [Mycobacterium sp.]
MRHKRSNCTLLTIHKRIVDDIGSRPGADLRPHSSRGEVVGAAPRRVSRGVHVKAWQFVGDGMPLTRNDVAEPVLRRGWVIVRVLGTGLCHTDVAFIDGDIPSSFMRHVPMTIGHEVAGVVVAVGESVTGLDAGDRVGVRSGPGGAGWAYHGGFAELMAAPAEHVVKAPEHVPFSHLAVGGDAGMVAHHAVARLGGAAPGVRMGIIGLGGLGCSGLQIAATLGASVYAAEPRTYCTSVPRHGAPLRCSVTLSALLGSNSM